MLSIPRPKTRGDCLNEARPCPWFGCRHHMVLEIARAKPRLMDKSRPTAIRLNGRPLGGRSIGGRRPGLRASAAAALVRTWIDDAVELASRLEYTCSLDVADAYPQGIPPSRIAEIWGVSEQLVDAEVREAKVELNVELAAIGAVAP